MSYFMGERGKKVGLAIPGVIPTEGREEKTCSDASKDGNDGEREREREREREGEK